MGRGFRAPAVRDWTSKSSAERIGTALVPAMHTPSANRVPPGRPVLAHR